MENILKVGQSLQVAERTSKDALAREYSLKIMYAGMPTDETFSLVLQSDKDGACYASNLYYPIKPAGKQIELKDMGLEKKLLILSVNPESITLVFEKDQE